MPLFGSRKHRNTQPATDGGRNENITNANAPGGGAGMTGRPNATNPGMGATQNTYPNAGSGTPGQGFNNGSAFGNDFDGSQGRHGTSGPGAGFNNQYGSTGASQPDSGIPPSGVLNHPDKKRGGAGQHLTGKVEHAMGSMIGSNALRAKGLQKQQEVNSINLQGQELAEAERLEREAMTRRERAVAHGAHPDNKYPGGLNPTAPSGPGSHN